MAFMGVHKPTKEELAIDIQKKQERMAERVGKAQEILQRRRALDDSTPKVDVAPIPNQGRGYDPFQEIDTTRKEAVTQYIRKLP